MKHGHSCNTPNELEIGEVILIAQAGVGIYLESVVVSGETQDESTQEDSHLHTAFLNATVMLLGLFPSLSLYTDVSKMVNKHNIFIFLIAASYEGNKLEKNEER